MNKFVTQIFLAVIAVPFCGAVVQTINIADGLQNCITTNPRVMAYFYNSKIGDTTKAAQESSMFDKVSDKIQGVTFVKLDLNEASINAIAAQNNAATPSTFVLYKDGTRIPEVFTDASFSYLNGLEAVLAGFINKYFGTATQGQAGNTTTQPQADATQVAPIVVQPEVVVNEPVNPYAEYLPGWWAPGLALWPYEWGIGWGWGPGYVGGFHGGGFREGGFHGGGGARGGIARVGGVQRGGFGGATRAASSGARSSFSGRSASSPSRGSFGGGRGGFGGGRGGGFSGGRGGGGRGR